MAPFPLNCRCGIPVRTFSSSQGGRLFGCGYSPSRCKVRARGTIIPVRFINPEAPLVTHVSLELTLHPKSKQEAFWVRPLDPQLRCLQELFADVNQFPDALYNTSQKQWVLPLCDYDPVVAGIAKLPVLLEEVPNYVFLCKKTIETQQLLFAGKKTSSSTPNPPQPPTTTSAPPQAVVVNEDIPCSSPVYNQLRSFQKSGVQFVLKRNGRGMIADEMGLGKTIQAICVAHHYRDEWPVLVICPGSLCENWKKEFMKFCMVPPSLIGVIHPPSSRAKGASHSAAGDVDLSIAQVVVVGYQNIKHLPKGVKYQVVIIDECHYVKSETTQRAKETRAICDTATRVVLLSGTPAMSRPSELYNQIMLIDPKGFMGKAAYQTRYCGGYFGQYGAEVSGHSNARELNMLLRHYIIRRCKKDVIKEMPAKARKVLYLHVTNSEKDLLKKRVSDLSNMANKSGNLSLGNQADLLELKVKTAIAKLPAVREYLKELVGQLVEDNEAILLAAQDEEYNNRKASSSRKPKLDKIIIFAHHTKMMEGVEKMLHDVLHPKLFEYIKITGETVAAQREALCDQFRQKPKCAVALLSMQAMGTGHNLTCANKVIFTELDWNPSTHLQCEDRIHRIGQEDNCMITYLLADGTADEAVWPMLQKKLEVTHAVLSTSDGQQIELDGGASKQDKEVVTRSDVCKHAQSGVSTSTLDGWLGVQPPRPRSPSPAVSVDECEELIPASQTIKIVHRDPTPPPQAPEAAAKKGQTTLLRFTNNKPSQPSTATPLADIRTVVELDSPNERQQSPFPSSTTVANIPSTLINVVPATTSIAIIPAPLSVAPTNPAPTTTAPHCRPPSPLNTNPVPPYRPPVSRSPPRSPRSPRHVPPSLLAIPPCSNPFTPLANSPSEKPPAPPVVVGKRPVVTLLRSTPSTQVNNLSPIPQSGNFSNMSTSGLSSTAGRTHVPQETPVMAVSPFSTTSSSNALLAPTTQTPTVKPVVKTTLLRRVNPPTSSPATPAPTQVANGRPSVTLLHRPESSSTTSTPLPQTAEAVHVEITLGAKRARSPSRDNSPELL